MSPPRRPFGADQPGRLQATMLKVLAAEMSDPGRLARGKRLRAEDAVVDLVDRARRGHGGGAGLAARPVRRDAAHPRRSVGAVEARRHGSLHVPRRRRRGRRRLQARGGGAVRPRRRGQPRHRRAGEVAPERHVRRRRRTTPRQRPDDDDAHDDPGPSPTTCAIARPAPPVDPLIAELTGLLSPPDGERLPVLPELTALDPPPASPTVSSPTSSTTRSPTCGCAGSDSSAVDRPRDVTGSADYFARWAVHCPAWSGTYRP